MTRGSRTVLRPAVAALVVAAIAAAAGTPVRTDDPVSSSVRFTGDIVRIFERKCQACHDTGGLAMPLNNYGDVRGWGRAIREEIVEQRMPPWTAARGFGRFRNDLSLSARETLTVLSWLDGGMPRGDDRDLPKPVRAEAVPGADLRIALPAQHVPALDDHVIRRVTVQAGSLDPTRAIARVAVSGHRGTLRGALVYEGSNPATARWVGAWLPWQREAAPPDGHVLRLARSASLSVELHYRGGDVETVDQPALEVYYAKGTGQPAVDEIAVIPGGAAAVSRAGTVWAIVPSGAPDGASLQLTARRPDGSSEILLWMPHVNRAWPAVLLLDQPVRLPAGTTVSLTAHPADPDIRVRLSVMR